MAFSDLGSAIDDSFGPTFFPPAPGPAGGDGTRSYCNGPRSGHWTVTSTIGSGIDDRCPTIWGANAGPYNTQQPGANVEPIAGSLLRKLAKASLEKQAAEAEVEDYTDGVTKIEQNARQHERLRETERAKAKQDAKPKGFYIPRANDMRGVKIAGQSGKDQVIRVPRVRPQDEKEYVAQHLYTPRRSLTDDYGSKASAKAKKARAPSPQPSLVSEKAASVASHINSPKPRMVRIRGKDGQEAFVELPNLPRPSSSPAPAAAAKYIHKEVKEVQTRPVKEAKIQKSKQERYEEDKTAAAKMAAKTMMSAASPPQQKKQRAQPVAKHDTPIRQSPAQEENAQKTTAGSFKSSTRDMGVGFGGLFETAATVASAHSSRAVSARSLQAAVQSISKNSSAAKTPTHNSFEQAARSRSRVRSAVPSKSRTHTPEHSFHGAVGFEEVRGGSAWGASVASQEQPPSEAQARDGSRQSTKPGDGHSPTVFAGRGWISPHPLSRSPSSVRSPPQSHISLPPDDFVGGATMTYQDWKAMQQEEDTQRRNFSKTESVVSSHVKAVAASIARNGSQASARQSFTGSQTFHRATVESEHGSQRQSVGSGNKQSSERMAAWSPAHAASPLANCWDAPPQFDGASEEGYTPSQEAAAAYEKQLQDIIAQYPPQMAYYGQAAGSLQPPQHETQLDMPWDEKTDSSSSVHRPSSSQQQSLATNTPPSAANYSQAYTASDTHHRIHPRKGRSPPMDAPIPMRFYDTADIEQSAGDYAQASLVPSAYNSAASAGFQEIDRAERGHGGRW
ncbi:hypothetical protein LTR85_007171 [Meristemomyces frigidus]|nr:hypothetical protein LTR85_007171 [Meristemomyces frigidus]